MKTSHVFPLDPRSFFRWPVQCLALTFITMLFPTSVRASGEFFMLTNAVPTQEAKLSEKLMHIVLYRPQVTYWIPLASCDASAAKIKQDVTFPGATVSLTIPMRPKESRCEEYRDGTERPEVGWLPKAKLHSVTIYFATEAAAELARSDLSRLIQEAPSKLPPSEEERLQRLLQSDAFWKKVEDGARRDGFP